MTDLFKAYSHQVASYHPAELRDELFAEVYDELCEEFGDWATAHPGQGQAEFLNSERQHPMKLATDLAAEGSAYLVGPRFYYSFLSTLKAVLAIVVVAHVGLAAVSVLTGTGIPAAAWGMLTALPGTLLWTGAAVLGVFVALEKSGEKASWLDKWDASDLRPADSHNEISRFETSFDLALSTLALLWILDIVTIPAVVRHDGQWVSEFSLNVPELAWWAAGLLFAFDIAFSLYRLGRTLWTRRLRLVTVASNLLWLVLLTYVVTRPELLATAHEDAETFLVFVEKALKGGLLVAVAIVAWETLSHAWKLLQR